MEEALNKTLDTVIKENDATEVGNMIKKAVNLKSLDELSMSKRAKTYLMSTFGSLDEIIWFGRNMSYVHAHYPRSIKRSKKSTLELIDALDKAGYIRHDINSGSFCINLLFRAIFYDTIDVSAIPGCLNDLCATVEKVSSSETIYRADYRMGNEKYESFEHPSYEQFIAVTMYLQSSLTEREYLVLTYRFGFVDGTHTLEETGKHFCVARERVRQIEARALRKLRRRNTMPMFILSLDEQRTEVTTVIKEIEELRKDPIFKKEAELMQRLREISKMPFECAKEATRYLDKGVADFCDIDRLELSVRAYNCLRRAGINTVADVLNLPKEDWPKVRNLGYRAMKEVEEKMREVGYADFSVEVLS